MTSGQQEVSTSESSTLATIGDDGGSDMDRPEDIKTLLDKESVVVSVSPHNQSVEDSENDESKDSNPRHTWARKLEYTLSVIGYCVGMSNVIRFPYLCVRNGGGAFLIPYFICLTVCGIPLFFMEVGLGQFMSRGALHVWNICPLFKGIGISMNILSGLSQWYFSIVFAYVLVYLANSVRSPLPWSQCGQEWNSIHCIPPGSSAQDYGRNANSSEMLLNASAHWMNSSSTGNMSSSASREFWLRYVLQLSPGLEDMGGLVWYTSLALFISCVLTFVCIIKSIRSVGKVVYVTALLPYILLTVLMIKGLTLTGAVEGITFYVYPNFNKLLLTSTWIEASIQVFYSLGPAYGGLITMASYNKFNNNCLRDSVILCFVCEGTSVFAGFTIFSILGHMAYNLNTTVSSFAQSGPGLAFVVYPEAISYLPLPQLWAVLFFLMCLTICIDSQFTLAETVLTTLQDVWPKFVTKWSIAIKCLYGVLIFLAALPFASRGGMYLFQLMDWYFAAFSVLVNAILECIIIGWIYGAGQFLDDLHFMCGKRPPYIFEILWRVVVPVLLMIILIITLLTYQPPVYEGYVYGSGAEMFGWIIACLPFLPIPFYSGFMLTTTKGTPMQRLKISCTPTSDWRPQGEELNKKYQTWTKYRAPCTLRLPKIGFERR